MSRVRWSVVAALAVLVLVGVTSCIPPRQEQPVDPLVGVVDPGSQLVGCDRATERLVLTGSTHLDPACTYTLGAEITASDVTLDCRGARLVRDPSETGPRIGILIESPADVGLHDVTVRNCVVKGFSNNLRVRRVGAKDLPPGQEYDNGFADVVVESSHFYDSEASGVFVDAYVSGVMLRSIEVSGSGAVGVYLEGGSTDNVVVASTIHHNGFGNVSPDGVPIIVNGVELRYESTGREGIAIDGSRANVVRGNWIAANSAGAIFLYKNCGEDATTRPNAHWARPYPASGNLIEGNVISAEKNGVWVSSRAAENQYFMDCSDAPYVDAPLRRVHLDPAPDNTIRANRFVAVTNSVRIEDDRTRVEGNTFSHIGGSAAVLIGTKERTAVLGRPVTGTVLTGNRTDVGGNPSPYRTVWGHTATTYSDNRSAGASTELVAESQPTINPFLFAIRVFAPPG